MVVELQMIESAAIAILVVLTLLMYFQQKFRIQALAVGLVLGAVSGFLQVPALLPLAILGFGLYLALTKKSWLKILGHCVVVFVSLALSFHIFPGFNNILAVNKVKISEGSLPYTLYFNFDKQIAAFALISLLSFRRDLNSLRQAYRGFWLFVIPVISLLIVLGLSLNWMRWEAKIPSFIGLWALKNLLFTCVSEEVFFRGYLQPLALKQWSGLRPEFVIAIVAALFGLVHFQGGAVYVFMATVAGFFYGLAAYRLKSLEAAILTHFSVNLIHLLLFTYPRLAA